MCRRSYIALFLTLFLVLLWDSATYAQSFPYHLTVESVSGHCYDDAHLVFTLLDDNNNVIQIDPQTHNAVNIAQYPLYNVQYHYQNVSSGGVQFDYDNDIMLMAGTYCVGVTANVPIQGGYSQVDTTFCNVQLTTSYQHLEASVLSNLALGNDEGHERYGYHPSFQCADMGRIQLLITQGSFPYEVTIMNEQQDTVRHAVFYHRVNSGTHNSYADYRDYYNFDTIPIGFYSIKISDSCGYVKQLSFTMPDAEPARYLALVSSDFSSCPDEYVIPFEIERRYTTGYGGFPWYNYMSPYLDSILSFRFINPGHDTTEWRHLTSPESYASSIGVWNSVYDTLSNFCVVFNDTIRMQLYDSCHDTLMTYQFRFLPQFNLHDTSITVHTSDSAINDTCTVHLQSGLSTLSYLISGDTWDDAGYTIYGGGGYYAQIPFRYYRCPLTYEMWSLEDATLLGQTVSDEFTGIGDTNWVTFDVDTSLSVHVSVTDAGGCLLAEKDTVFVYHPIPIDSLLFWFECHNDIDDDGWEHCCSERYLWIQEHGVEADTFRRNMTLRLFESPLYNHLNFTAVRQDGVWSVSFDDVNNHTTYIEFSYGDGWRATIYDSVCLPPGRYKFEVTTDCGVDTIIKEWAGFYYDSLGFTSSPQYEMHQVCDKVVVSQVFTGLENYAYYIDPAISNDSIIRVDCQHALSLSSSGSIYGTKDPSTGYMVLSYSVPGTYYLNTYSYNEPSSYYYQYHHIMWCHPEGNYVYAYDTITIEFSYIDFDVASALLCDATSTTGVVSAQTVNGNPPYTYTLYDQPGTAGNVIATNSTGFFEDVPMTLGQQFSVQVTDSCSTSFSVNVTAVMLTQGSLLWEPGASVGVPHLDGDTAHLTALTFPPPATYQWTGPNGFSSTSQSVDIILSDSSYSGWYYVQIFNSFCGQVITDSVYITVVSPPQVIVLYDTVCQWAGYEDNGFMLTGAETSMPGTFTLTRLEQTGYYADTIILNLTVNPSVTTVVEITALGNYTWNGVTYTASGAYIRHTDGCGMETLLLTITDTLGVTIVADDDTLCRGEGSTLDAQVTNAYALPPVAVGDILCTDGDIVKPSLWPVAGKTALGVVFYVDTSGAHGWAVHLHDQGTSVRWRGNANYVDIPTLVNYDASNMDIDGYANTEVLRGLGDASLYPAAWAVDFPNGWYLPAISQLRLLFGELKTINSTLEILNGTPFPMNSYFRYWSSTEKNVTHAMEVTESGDAIPDGKYTLHYVRSVRDF